jgi:hypothetical protein
LQNLLPGGLDFPQAAHVSSAAIEMPQWLQKLVESKLSDLQAGHFMATCYLRKGACDRIINVFDPSNKIVDRQSHPN